MDRQTQRGHRPTTDACIQHEELAALAAGTLTGTALQGAVVHVAACDECRESLASMRRGPASESRAAFDSRTALDDQTEASRGAREAAPAAEVGSALGRYRLVAEVGRGGMGVVYEAHDPKLDRRVALKMLLHRRDAETLARMTREAQAVARLSHPNVVQIFDVNLAGATPYLVMEFVDGPTLRDWCRAEKKPRWQRILRAYVQAGRGLAAAHRVGLVHRDFKPANAIVDRRGHVKVLDFGLARTGMGATAENVVLAIVGDNDSTLTATGIAMGTPSYMAPEQHRGDRPDERADIYAFGAALHEALYGTRAFEGATAELLYGAKQAGLDAEPPDSAVPDEVYRAVRKALAFDPADRWSSMDALVATLRRTLRKRGRSVLRWALPGAAVLGIATLATMEGPEASVAVSPGESVGRVDLATEDEAQQLIDEARQRGFDQDGARGLGSAYVALSLAAASGSERARGRALLQLGGSLIDVGELRMAVPELRKGIDIARALGDDAVAATAATRLIYALGALGRSDEALEAGRLARALAERVDDDGALLVNIIANEAVALPASRDAEATERYEQALAMRLNTPSLNSPLAVAMLQNNLGSHLKYTDPERARELLEDAIETRREVLGPDAPLTLNAMLTLVMLKAGAGRPTGCLDAGIALYERAPPSAMVVRAQSALLVATCLNMLKRPEEGLLWAERALDLPGGDQETNRYADVLQLKGMFLAEQGKFELAEELLQHGVVIKEARANGPDAAVAMAYHNLASTILFSKREANYDRAETYFRRALDEMQRCPVPDGSGLLYIHVAFAKLLEEQGRFAEARDLLRVPVEETPLVGPTDNQATKLAEAKGLYARALWETTRDRSHALELARAALEELVIAEAGGERDEDELRLWLEARRN